MYSPIELLVLTWLPAVSCFFFFNDTATTEIYTLSLHDAFRSRLSPPRRYRPSSWSPVRIRVRRSLPAVPLQQRSEEHTSELQSHLNLVCRLLLEKKNSSPTFTMIPSPQLFWPSLITPLCEAFL